MITEAMGDDIIVAAILKQRKNGGYPEPLRKILFCYILLRSMEIAGLVVWELLSKYTIS